MSSKSLCFTDIYYPHEQGLKVFSRVSSFSNSILSTRTRIEEVVCKFLACKTILSTRTRIEEVLLMKIVELYNIIHSNKD